MIRQKHTCFALAVLLFLAAYEVNSTEIKSGLLLTFVSQSFQEPIIFQARDGSTVRIFIARNDRTIEQLTSGPFDAAPVVALGGGAVFFENIYHSEQHSLFQIAKLDLGSGKIVPISDRTFNDSGLALSPDGKTIAFSSKSAIAKDKWRLYLMDADGKNRRPLDPDWDKSSQIQPSWSPDGSHLVYVFRSFQNPIKGAGKIPYYRIPSLKVFDLQSNTDRIILRENIPAEQPCWSPKGNRIVFASPDAVNKTRSLWIADLNPLTLTQLTQGSNDRYPVWQKDGNHIIFSRKHNSRATICRVNIKTQKVTELFYSETSSLDFPQLLTH